MPISYPNRCAARSRAFAASSSRLRGGALVSSETSSFFETAATSSTARSNAASFAFEGLWKPESLRTNCSEAARTSSSVTGGSKLNSVLMLRHMADRFLEEVGNEGRHAPAVFIVRRPELLAHPALFQHEL